jgi:hypothetical protein
MAVLTAIPGLFPMAVLSFFFGLLCIVVSFR